jgi:hypothetical protein
MQPHDAAAPHGGGGAVPEDLATEETKYISFSSQEATLIRRAEAALLHDERFEHLERKASEAVWRLFCRAFLNRGM